MPFGPPQAGSVLWERDIFSYHNFCALKDILQRDRMIRMNIMRQKFAHDIHPYHLVTLPCQDTRAKIMI